MALANEDRGVLVGAFIVEEGDEVLSITQTGQVVRSPINDQFRATGRSTMGVKFVTPKSGDAVAVVARSVEAKDEEALAAEAGEPSTRRSTRRVSSRSADDADESVGRGRRCNNRRDRHDPTRLDRGE